MQQLVQPTGVYTFWHWQPNKMQISKLHNTLLERLGLVMQRLVNIPG